MPRSVTVGQLERLTALAERLERAVAQCEERNLAPLAGRLQAVLAEIAVLEKATVRGSKVDELAGRRKTRRANAAGRGDAGGDSRVVGS